MVVMMVVVAVVVVVVVVFVVVEVTILTLRALIAGDGVFVVCRGRCRAVNYVCW
jgi:hypothetical protein